MNRPATTRTAAASDASASARVPWAAPELQRLGTVAALTTKVDTVGKNDGGKWPKRRT